MMFAKLRKIERNTKNKIVFYFFILSLSILFLFLQRRKVKWYQYEHKYSRAYIIYWQEILV